MANIMKKYTLSAKGILSLEDGIVGLEDVDTGELINFTELLADFDGKSIKMSINYDEDYSAEE